ncbi:MAG: prepilin-type N-terminal cleavage/methylation domain-containing protein [Candidatus Levybacteria bacterium]|nr:prepilin-type N-terminal cleavage/methylation domain-containing protein [Candidatus Levybacteria bacterium]
MKTIFISVILNSFQDLILEKTRCRNKFGMTKRMEGFTLIELLIAIIIIGILITGLIAVINPAGQIQKANDARRKGDLSQIQKALEIYYQTNRSYPPNPSVGDYRIKGLDGITVNWGDSWLPFMGNLPKDPNSSRKYVYYASGQTYYLYASLDRGKEDPGVCNNGADCQSVPAANLCGSGNVCNYGVSSPNVSP